MALAPTESPVPSSGVPDPGKYMTEGVWDVGLALTSTEVWPPVAVACVDTSVAYGGGMEDVLCVTSRGDLQ